MLATQSADHPGASRVLSRLDAPSIQRADLAFFRIRSSSVDHVAIYLVDDRFIHVPRRDSNVRIDHLSNAYWARHFQLAKRVVHEALGYRSGPRLGWFSGVAARPYRHPVP